MPSSLGMHLAVDAVPLDEPPADGQRPRRVDPRAEHTVHGHPPVAQLVAEALDHDRAVVGQVPGRLPLLVAGRPAGCRRPTRPGPLARSPAAARLVAGRVSVAQPGADRPAQLDRAARLRRPSRTASGPARPGAGETSTRSGVMSSIRHEVEPSRNTSPTRDS